MSDEKFKRAAKQISLPGLKMCPKTGAFLPTSPSIRKIQKELDKTKSEIDEKLALLDEKLAELETGQKKKNKRNEAE